MFKNYLTYNLALSFHRTCLTLESVPNQTKERLMRSSETMIHHFARAVHSQNSKDEAKYLYVTLTCLRDCKETLEEAKLHPVALFLQYEVLHGRLQQICLKLADKEQGQLRMLG